MRHLSLDLRDLPARNFESHEVHYRLAIFFKDCCGADDALPHVDDVEAIRRQPGRRLPKAFADLRLDGIFGELDCWRHGKIAGLVRHEGIEILRHEAAQTFTITGRVRLCCRAARANEEEKE